MPGKDRRLKSFEIIDDESEVDKISSAFVIPINPTEADLIVVDDVGQERRIRTGGGGDKTWIHDQHQPSATWTIDHTLYKKVSVTIQDTAGTQVMGEIVENTGTKVVIKFNFPFSGFAYLN